MQDVPKGLDRIADRVRTVDVSNNMLDSVPASLTPLSRIERLVMVNNNISSILCDMADWSKLKVCAQSILNAVLCMQTVSGRETLHWILKHCRLDHICITGFGWYLFMCSHRQYVCRC